MMKPHQVVARIFVSIALLFMLFSFGALVRVYAGNETSLNRLEWNDQGSIEAEMRTVYVYSGDTLWSIARDNKTEQQDIRDYVLQLKKVNKLKSSFLREGQILVLP